MSEAWSWPCTPTGTKVQSDCSCTSSPPYDFKACTRTVLPFQLRAVTNLVLSARYEVCTVTLLMSHVFCEIMPCWLSNTYLSFKLPKKLPTLCGTSRFILCLQEQRSDNYVNIKLHTVWQSKLVTVFQLTRCNIPEDMNLNPHWWTYHSILISNKAAYTILGCKIQHDVWQFLSSHMVHHHAVHDDTGSL
jgi:hypothetical protein